jgi:hypothetical protein
MAEEEGRSYKKLFWWTLGILGALLTGLVLLSLSSPDSPFTYVIQ